MEDDQSIISDQKSNHKKSIEKKSVNSFYN